MQLLVEENERQQRLLATQAEQVKHVSQRAISARREADVAAAEREQALKDLEAAQRDASDAKNASWLHREYAEQRTQQAAEVATGSMKRSKGSYVLLAAARGGPRCG